MVSTVQGFAERIANSITFKASLEIFKGLSKLHVNFRLLPKPISIGVLVLCSVRQAKLFSQHQSCCCLGITLQELVVTLFLFITFAFLSIH